LGISAKFSDFFSVEGRIAEFGHPAALEKLVFLRILGFFEDFGRIFRIFFGFLGELLNF
jgi:hypothetical protein